MTGHYTAAAGTFRLFESHANPMWRPPQIGALGELLGHWSVPNRPPALVSVPTGSGKSAVATAAPYLANATRVLVVVPSRDVRRQLAAEFASESVLHRIGARTDPRVPSVHEVTARISDWQALRTVDVVVGIPASISPTHYEQHPPPSDLFDLVIVDEAHHAPAPTWRAIIEHFAARALLLTATPTRRDGQRVPGDLVYHYPLRQAIDDQIYQPVEPIIVDVGHNPTRELADLAVVQQTVALVNASDHSSSAVLIRTASVERAREVAKLYIAHGVHVEVLTSRLGPNTRKKITDDLRSGSLKAVAVVDMLGEGFDLPRIRIAAYHDKHKSVNATIQLIGRLARVDNDFPQQSVIVTARDQNVYPQLRGLVRGLWEEDADWATVLPGLIDDQVTDSLEDRQFADHFSNVPPDLSIEALQPLVRTVIHEVQPGRWEPSFAGGGVPDGLVPGQVIAGRTVYYSGITPSLATLILVTTSRSHPKWMADPGLDSSEYELHLFSWSPTTAVDQPHLFIVNSPNRAISRQVMEILGADSACRLADPVSVQDAFDSISRSSVSNVGVRNTYMGGRGTASYRTYAASGVDRGLRAADTANSALGHAMAQVTDGSSSFNIGIATGKAKYWESRYVRIRDYENRIDDFVSRFRFPPATGPGRLLPALARGERLEKFPASLVVAIELNARLRGRAWQVGNTSLDQLDFYRDEEAEPMANRLPLVALTSGREPRQVWKGWQDPAGIVHEVDGHAESDILEGQILGSAQVRRGWGTPRSMSDLLTDHPLTIFFGDGSAIIGETYYPRPFVSADLPGSILITEFDWSPYDIRAETDTHAQQRAPKNPTSTRKPSVHAALEKWLKDRPHELRHRWIFCNDGKGELADYVVLEVETGPRVHLSLWHAKASGADAAAVRVTDLQVVVTQAFKSRRWATDATLWQTLRARYGGQEAPPLKLVAGRPRLFEVLCGMDPNHPLLSLDQLPPAVTCEIGIVQPGLSYSQLQSELARNPVPLQAQQVRELLSVCNDAVMGIGKLRLLVAR